MAKLGFYLLLVFSFRYIIPNLADSVVATAPDPAATDFIKASCRTTRYPALCIRCLSSYASKIQQNEKQMALVALSVTLARVQSVSVFVSNLTKVSGMKPIEHQAVQDCTINMGDSVAQLSRSIQELSQMGRAATQGFGWHVNNVQTWVSTALTDVNTCIDGFGGPAMEGNVKAAIKIRMDRVAQFTSNALALINRFAARGHQASATTSMP